MNQGIQYLPKHQRGQSMVEFNLSLPFLMPIILVAMMLVVQWGFIYSAKSTLDAATVQAVRAGALHHGAVSEMRQGLANAMMPLFAQGTSTADTLKAQAKAKTAAMLQSQIRILSPDNQVFDAFMVRSKYPSGYVYELPNNNLMYRNPQLKSLGGDRRMNVQDANLLQIEIRWCQKLIVPMANDVINQIVTSALFNPNADQIACNALGTTTGDSYIALVSQGLMRMQTPFRL
jgi:hypothetical protein